MKVTHMMPTYCALCLYALRYVANPEGARLIHPDTECSNAKKVVKAEVFDLEEVTA
jgi:hypothetical protein